MRPYYEEDGIAIYHGDCREILHSIAAAWLVTDPPYGIGLRNGDVDGHRSTRWNTVQGDHDQVAGRAVLSWAEAKMLPSIVFASPWLAWPGEWRNLIVWDKGGAVGGGGDIDTCLKRSWELIQVARNPRMPGSRAESVWRFPLTPQNTASHICAKPLTLMQRLFLQFGADEAIDPFMGSGTTLVAAKNLGRKAIGIEIEERYCEIAAKRLAQCVLEFA